MGECEKHSASSRRCCSTTRCERYGRAAALQWSPQGIALEPPGSMTLFRNSRAAYAARLASRIFAAGRNLRHGRSALVVPPPSTHVNRVRTPCVRLHVPSAIRGGVGPGEALLGRLPRQGLGRHGPEDRGRDFLAPCHLQGLEGPRAFWRLSKLLEGGRTWGMHIGGANTPVTHPWHTHSGHTLSAHSGHALMVLARGMRSRRMLGARIRAQARDLEIVDAGQISKRRFARSLDVRALRDCLLVGHGIFVKCHLRVLLGPWVCGRGRLYDLDKLRGLRRATLKTI